IDLRAHAVRSHLLARAPSETPTIAPPRSANQSNQSAVRPNGGCVNSSQPPKAATARNMAMKWHHGTVRDQKTLTDSRNASQAYDEKWSTLSKFVGIPGRLDLCVP